MVPNWKLHSGFSMK